MDERAWKDILARYGQRVKLLRDGEEKELRAFFQPVEEKAPGMVPTPLGVAPAGKWLYLGPVEEDLEGVEVLTWEGRAFGLLRHRGIPLGEGFCYRWGIFYELDDEVRA